MIDNFVDFLEKIIIKLFKLLVKALKNVFKSLLKIVFKLTKKLLINLRNYLSKKLNIPKEKFRDYYNKYILAKFLLFKKNIKLFKHKKLLVRFAIVLLFVSVLMSSYFIGPNVVKHYKSTDNSLSFVEYNTHVDNSNNSQVVQVSNTTQNEPAPAPAPEPAPAPAPEPAPTPVDTSYRWPTESNYYITTYFSRAHDGIDIAGCGWNSNIYAIYSGEVVTSSFTSTNGNYIIIKDDKGVYSMYAHLANKYVWAGQRVEKGHVIGGMGATGFATGTHLHFSTWYGYPYYGGTPFNPYSLY